MRHRSIEEAKEAALACSRVLRQRFGVKEVYSFGSVAGQGPWHCGSDIDLGVEGLSAQDYMTALSDLWNLLPEGMEIDLVRLEDAPPELVSRIKGEVKFPDDPREALKKEISDELTSLERIVGQLNQLLGNRPTEPTFIETNAAGKLLHDFYSGAERIFERVAIRLGPGVPDGPGWHTLLLRGMESGVDGVRGPVIDHSLASRLVDYLRFRHLFRHSYGYDLEWGKLDPLLQDLEQVFLRLRSALEGFCKTLTS